MSWGVSMRTRISSGGIEITNQCNLYCKHCYLGESRDPKIFMKLDQILYIIEQCAHLKAQQIVVSGGEPFLHPDITSLIHKLGTQYSHIPFVIATNGTLLDKRIIGMIRPYDNIQIQISLDGATKTTHEKQHGTNTFERIISTLQEMRDIPRNRKNVRMTISRLNYRECAQVAEIAKQYNAEVSYAYVTKVGCAEKNWDCLNMTAAQSVYANELISDFYRKNKGYIVNIPKSVLSCPFEDDDCDISLDIHANGDANICTCLDSKCIVGNVFKDDFIHLINSSLISDLTKRICCRKALLRDGVCRDCSALVRCQQGCIGRAIYLGDEFGLDDQCDFRRALQFKNYYLYLNFGLSGLDLSADGNHDISLFGKE